MNRVPLMTATVNLRIVLVSPPPDVTFCIQGKPGELIDPVRSDGGDIAFDFSVRLGDPLPDGRPRFLGRVVQGPPVARFVYMCSGTMAGDAQYPRTIVDEDGRKIYTAPADEFNAEEITSEYNIKDN